MDSSFGDRIAVEALRLGLHSGNLLRFETPLTLQVETLVLRRPGDEPAPLVLCIHPGRFCEFQAAQRLRDLVQLDAHVAFPRGLHAHQVDLGGARTVGYGWYHDTGDNPAYRRSLAAAVEYLGRVLARLQEQLRIRPDATFVIGAEDTTLLATLLAMHHGRTITGAAIIDGALPAGVLDDYVPRERLTHFLRVHRCMRRPRRDVATDREADQLRTLGYPVDLRILEGHDRRWHEESALLIDWLAEEMGLALPDVP